MLCNPNELCNSIKISNQIEWNFSSFYRNVFLCSAQRQILVWYGFSIKLLGVPCPQDTFGEHFSIFSNNKP